MILFLTALWAGSVYLSYKLGHIGGENEGYEKGFSDGVTNQNSGV